MTALPQYPDYERDYLRVVDFLQNFEHDGIRTYIQQLTEISNRERRVLEVRMDDIETYNADEEFTWNFKHNTLRYISLVESAADDLLPQSSARPEPDIFDNIQGQRLKKLQSTQREDLAAQNEELLAIDSGVPKSLLRRFDVLITPLASDPPRRIRDIKANDIGALVKVNGIVTRATGIKPQVTVVTYVCELCGCEILQEVVGTQFMPLLQCSSQRCKDNGSKGRLQMQSRGSKFTKYQEIKLQELPNQVQYSVLAQKQYLCTLYQVPVGHIPRSIKIRCHGEVTRSCSPGDVIVLSGVFLAVKTEGFKSLKSGLQAETYIEAFKIERAKQNFTGLETLECTRELMREVANDSDPFSRLASSIAPEIYGHEDVKKALLLQLVGGVSKSLEDGMKIRGDINVLLMGDPGVAKSQLYNMQYFLIYLSVPG